MSRYGGLILLVLLAVAGVALRGWSDHRAERLLAGEAHARTTLLALHSASATIVESGRPHPGMEGLLHVRPGLELIRETDGLSFARDAVYIYGVAPTETRDAQVHYGYILRAWPLAFGVTGDFEFQIRDDGELWVGLNERGRSGLAPDQPTPPFPDPKVGVPSGPWWPIDTVVPDSSR